MCPPNGKMNLRQVNFKRAKTGPEFRKSPVMPL